MASECAASGCCSDARNNQNEDVPVLEQSIGDDESKNGSRNGVEHDGGREPAADTNSTSSSKKRCSSWSSSGRGLDDEEMEKIIRHRDQDPASIEERRRYQKIARTFRNYVDNVNKKLSKSLEYISTLPDSHRKLLENYREHLLNVKRCGEENQNLFLLIAMEESRLFENHASKAMKKTAPDTPEPTAFDLDKLQAVLKQIVRDWTEEGQRERDQCYKPILEEIDNIFGKTKGPDGLSDIKILVPGAGLGRLTHDLVRLGYAVEGNEFCLFMLFASNFILNKCSGRLTYRCFPWIHQSTNVLNTADQVRPVHFPDIDTSVLQSGSRFSMTAGDFLEVYGNLHQKEKWDCIVTCFFIDCANNILEYLERIYYCLKFGGTWINLGPLLYYYADTSDERSIEPPYDMLIEIVKKLGFLVEKEKKCIPTLYSYNSKSMLSYTYNSVFLVCTKSNSATNGN